MHVLVAYASRHGATQGIAEHIATTIGAAGLNADALSVTSVTDLSDYDAFVIGSAAYMFHWLKDATTFVRRNRAALAARPVWLFSSGPIGTDPLTPKGVDQKVAAVPKEIAELSAAVAARDHRVFFGAIEAGRKPIGGAERLMALVPASRDALPIGDFRDWPEIEAWAVTIANELRPASVAELSGTAVAR